MVIWKAVLKEYGATLLSVPKGTKFLSCHLQYDAVMVWYMCDPSEKELEDYLVVGVITGGISAPLTGDFLGTIISDDGDYVEHYFVRKIEL